jgi:hypothetical protein
MVAGASACPRCNSLLSERANRLDSVVER